MSDSRPLKAPRRSPSVERRSLRTLPLILLLVWGGWVFSGWRVSVTLLGCVASEGRQARAEQCYSSNARGIVRDGEASVPVLTASLGFRQHSTAAWCLQTQCILEKLFPVVFVHLQCDDCTIQHSLLYWGGGGLVVMMGCHYLCGKLGVLFETALPLPMSSFVLSWLNINVFSFIPATEGAGIEPKFSCWLRLLRLSDATCERSVVHYVAAWE